MIKDKIFLNCEHCGKRLIERMPNGLFRFVFGGRESPPVEILIAGSVRVKCLRKSCKHWNEFSFLPNVFK